MASPIEREAVRVCVCVRERERMSIMCKYVCECVT